jgi:hypothetical protein
MPNVTAGFVGRSRRERVDVDVVAAGGPVQLELPVASFIESLLSCWTTCWTPSMS